MAGADVVTTLRTSVAPASWILTLWLSGKRSGWTRNLVLSRIDFEPVRGDDESRAALASDFRGFGDVENAGECRVSARIVHTGAYIPALSTFAKLSLTPPDEAQHEERSELVPQREVRWYAGESERLAQFEMCGNRSRRRVYLETTGGGVNFCFSKWPARCRVFAWVFLGASNRWR